MRLKQGCSGIWIAAAAAAIDQISKSAIRRIYENRPSLWLTGSGRLWEWQGLFAIRATSNTGVAFSMLSSSGIALILFTALIIAALTGWLIAKPNALPKTARAGMWMIIGGGLGNLYDRIVYGAVMDFIEPLFVRFAVFNVADIAIVCGAILTAVSIYIDESRKDTAHEREI